MSLQPPVPFADFEFTFDPSLSSLFPAPPPLPPSADLFSPDETTDLLGFLDNFGDLGWDLAADPYEHISPPAPYANPHIAPAPPRVRSTRGAARPRSATSESSAATTPTAARPKTLLSTPQKRLNHIMSEQKRRNAIRDGYAQLIALMAPAGSAPGLGMPTRGRPKGSGTRGKGQSKGKSGVLFRAVEYCRWLHEGRDALLAEVQRVEAAAAALRHA
ncbi:hypothetical protein HYPSUDRAFT_62182 [Hypholoma sublateritium FD-334 SS-4]|uniref:BHLH domain-containing protein n=1 Tax=Hypholoma sublateritium (strain FD-334 SS-4) TaxID=945553 RepID=A0A0D2MWY4_HYPSF|nr:hypothetical protein HYPSUDRAFT_62182 [Hypholoma sublateritium FD-334 SS-4]